MKIVSNSPSFGSLYKYNITSSNSSSVSQFENEMYKKLHCEPEETFSNLSEISKTGIYAKSSLYVDDRHDNFIESLLKQKNIQFTKVTREEATNLKNINNRIIIPSGYEHNHELVGINVKKLDKLLQEEESFYITSKGKKGAINDRYDRAFDYISTGKDINASILVLNEYENGIHASIVDGRHRYAVMRDMGMETINFAMDSNSIKLAQKYKLLA